MKTVSILIGNSDNKLSQECWAAYINSVKELIHYTPYLTVHFVGFTEPHSQYQSACWVFEIKEKMIPALEEALKKIGAESLQDSIAMVIGETTFVKCDKL